MLCIFASILLIAAIFYKAFEFYLWKTTQPTFAGKTIFITGASSGIGESLTKRLIQLGAKKVIIASRNVKEMERVKQECVESARVQIEQMDLSKPEECLKKASEIAEREKQIDILINNAGITMREEFINTEYQTCVMMMNTNCMSHIAITKGLIKTLIAQSKGAQILNIISVSGLIGTGFRTMYTAAKFGTAGFFKALRAEVRQYGVGITNIYPEFVKTNISKNAVLGGGQTFGKTDTNISSGIEVDEAVDTILRATYLKYDEVIVGRIEYHILPSLCFLSSTINNLIGKIAYKRSQNAIANAH